MSDKEHNPTAPEEPVQPKDADPKLEATRQWVSIPQNSCNVRIGHGNLQRFGSDLITFVGKPHKAMLLSGENASAELVEHIFTEMTSEGFSVKRGSIPDGEEALKIESAPAIYRKLDEAGITSDDAIVVVGDAAQLDLVSFVAGGWCGGTPVAAIPLDVEALMCATVTPAGLTVGGHPGMVQGRNSIRNVFADFAVMSLEKSEQRSRALVTMVATAVSDTQNAFELLYNRRQDLADNNEIVWRDQFNESLRSRGRIVSSTSIAVRQSLEYGQTFARALKELTGDEFPNSTLFAEGLRFMARLACVEEGFSIDDMLAQDEVLETFGLGTVQATIDPDDLFRAMHRIAFMRSDRFMVALPRGFGRVRLATLDPESLKENLAAWCAQHAKLQTDSEQQTDTIR